MKEYFFIFICLFSLRCFPETNSVVRGEYLAKASDCTGCHTVPGKKPFAGGLPVNTPFGQLVTPNITPDAETGIGTWTKDDFYKALHEGINKNNENLYPAFPYVFFTKIPKQDVDDLYEYLRTIKPVRNLINVNRLRFPYSNRNTLWFWKFLYFKAGTYQNDSSKSAEWNRGAYLVNGPAHCGACHTPRNFMGAVKESQNFAGAKLDNWLAPNITSDMSIGIGDWTVDDIIEFFKSGVMDQTTSTLGPMEEVVQNSLSQLTDQDIKAMAIYLKTVPPNSNSGSYFNQNAKKAKILFLENCAGCHHPKGLGRPGQVPPLANNPVIESKDPSNMVSVLLLGIPVRNGLEAMPSFSKLSNDDLSLILNYVQARWGSGQSEINPKDIESLRQTINKPR